jgi:ureidoacrylate peracid hydrolase
MNPVGNSVSSDALLVIDMQNSFCHAEGVMRSLVGPIDQIEAQVKTLARTIAETRSNGVPIVYLRMVFQPNYADADAVFRHLLPEAMQRGALARGSWDADIIDELAPHAKDTVIDKTRFDGFHATPLATTLAGLGVRRVLVSGAYTNVCVEITCKSAYQYDFEPILLADCVGALDRRVHDRAIDVLRESPFAAISSSTEYLAGSCRTTAVAGVTSTGARGAAASPGA